MEALTYSLQNGQKNSNAYYDDVRAFSDIVVKKADKALIPIINEFTAYLDKYKLDKIRQKEEYILELLSFGVLWRSYSQIAQAVHMAPFLTLSKMAEWRKKHQRVKPLIDFARGILMTLLMLPDRSKIEFTPIPTLEQIDHVCKWFEATGEFKEQAVRFIYWRAWWETEKTTKLNDIFNTIYKFTQWFANESCRVIGKYTQEVDKFINTSEDGYRWREDRIQCTRSRLEYHLNMVGAELMNRAFRTEFESAKHRAVLVPGCMRALPADQCEAVRVEKGLICQGCTASCRVNQLREMGKKRNFQVYIIPHSSDLSLWTTKEGEPLKGVVASACVTTLVEGGWELKRYNVPAQCVLLDYCGCQKHWHPKGVTTKLNISELKRILQN
jgi:uncharacterized protein